MCLSEFAAATCCSGAVCVSICHCVFNACVAPIHAMLLQPEPEQSDAWLLTGCSGSE